MKLLNSISKIVPFVSMALILLSSQKMKDGDAMHIEIDWKTSPSHEFNFESAIYPDEFNGLPVASISLPDEDVTGFSIQEISKIAIDPDMTTYLDSTVNWNDHFVSLTKYYDRGRSESRLNICPFMYDSVARTYFQISQIEIKLNDEKERRIGSYMRRGASDGNSVLADGVWVKIPVQVDGVYKIDYNYLLNAGFEVASIDPRNLKLFGNGGGMLPQKNNEERPIDLIENAVSIQGESDGRFDRDDYILFYGQGADYAKLLLDGTLAYDKNIYSDTAFYFLTEASEQGLRIADKENLGKEHQKIQHFDDYILYEKDEFNIINSGREWYGEKFDFTLTYDFKFDFGDLVPDTELKVTSAIMGQTYQEASMDLFANGVALGQQPVYSIVEGAYLAKGSNQIQSFEINSSLVPPSDQFTLRMSFNPVGTVKSRASLNYLLIQGQRKLQLNGTQMKFRALKSTETAISTYEIGVTSEGVSIWDITEPLKPYQQKYVIEGDQSIFGAIANGLNEYIIFRDVDFLIPGDPIKIQNQNLRATGNKDLLIISHPIFLSEAERLADLRRSHDGLDVMVVTTNEIYNEYSSGKQDVSAIRDYIKFVYEQGEENDRLQNVLLFGKGSFDYKDRTENNSNFVPIYTSRNSLHPINSYASDDYYGFLDEAEGEWVESYAGDHLMDVGVGRLPVKDLNEAKIVVDKLIRYSTNSETYGSWRNELFFIADDGDGNLHQRDADRLTVLVDSSYHQFNTNKIYVDAFEQVESSIGEVAPGVNDEIDRSMKKGGLIFNFTGHGSTTRWTSETILNISSAAEFENPNRLPLFVTATCEFGRHDNPKAISGAEYLLLNPNGGAIGLLTTSRPVYSSTNFILNTRFYQNVFKQEEGEYLTMGEIFRRTKNQSLNGSVNRNFSLLGDPSMTLAYAKDKMVLLADEDVYQPGDTISALGTVKFKGQIRNQNDQINSSFNGIASIKVFDKPSRITTFGHEDAPMTYSARDNIIFNGLATVKDGEFDVEFIVPKNISFDFDLGKISMYAMNNSKIVDASGANIEFVVGGQTEEFAADNTPPEINLFINDTSFLNKGITGPDVFLVARLKDESGISLSKSEEGNEILAFLDDESEHYLSNYYISKQDTYKEGWVTYPFQDLSIGIHKIRLTASDVHNNSNEAEIEFLVVEDRNLTIEKLINYPNPFSDFTRFSFEHNRAGDDLEILIEVYSSDGKMLKQFAYTKENSESRIADIFWDGKDQNGSNIRGGVYVFRLSVRSLSDSSKKHAYQKLVIIN